MCISNTVGGQGRINARAYQASAQGTGPEGGPA